MTILQENQFGVQFVWLRKNEDFPRTYHITRKQGFYIYSPNQGESWKYLGTRKPCADYLAQWFVEKNQGV